MRKVINLVARVCDNLGLSSWRQNAYNVRKLKRLYRKAQSLKRSKAKKKEKVEEKSARIAKAHREYIDQAGVYLEKAKATLDFLLSTNRLSVITYDTIKHYMRHAVRQIDQIHRRVLNGEKIPHEEIAIPFIKATKERFPELVSCSFDKNFYTPANRKQLDKILDLVVLPKKGRRSEEERLFESSDDFVRQRRQHPAVESGINALENHSLDRCLDHGLRGFERYVALAVVSRNIQILGTIIWKRKLRRRHRETAQQRKAA